MNQDLMRHLQQMQRELKDGQTRIEESEYRGRATGVEVLLSGAKTMLDIQIKDEILSDKEILQDSICIAINDALRHIDKDLEDLFKKYKMPGGMGF
jgi:DNA-binding YbaB/EbfC family protein